MSDTSLTETIYALVVKENAMAAWKWLCKNDLSKRLSRVQTNHYYLLVYFGKNA
jgi:hypothetical protein